MAIKLLDKKQIKDLKNNERRIAIDEGVKIAKKVDSLRELKLIEEAHLEKYRKETLERIMGEITQHTQVRDALYQEVRTLEARREEALRPLTRESEELETKRVEVSKLIQEQREIEAANTQKEADISKSLKSILAKEQEIERARALANDALQEAASSVSEANRILSTAKDSAANINADLSQRQEKMRQAELQAMSTLERQALRDIEQDRKEKDLLDRERRIRDREELLERNIKRLKV